MREYGTTRAAKVLRFIHSLAESISIELNTLVAVPNSHATKKDSLSAVRDDEEAKTK